MTPDLIDRMLKGMSHKDMADTLAIIAELEARKRVLLAQSDFLAFIAAIDPLYKFGIHLKKLGALLMQVELGVKDRIAVSMAPRFGKLLADDTPMWTPDGWRAHGDLQPGDWVYHPSGALVQVVAISEPALANMRVEMTDGAVLYCHERHEWAVRKRNNGRENAYEVVETQELAKRKLLTGTADTRGSKYIYQLPPRAACEAPDADLLVPPYVLGAWLGDGTSTKACVTHSEADQPYVDRIASHGYSLGKVFTHATTGVRTSHFSPGGKGRGNGGRLRYELQTLGVFGNKHIPVVYLTASVTQRLALLAGLIDTDGTRNDTGRYTFTSVSRRLAHDVATLARTLGWRTGIVEVAPRLSSSGIQGTRPYYMVSFCADRAFPVALDRKAFLKPPAVRSVAVKSVTRDPQGKIGRCIQVDAPDGLYLAGTHLTPTHNSQMISIYYPAWYLGKHPEHKLIMASHTSDLAIDMARKVRNLMQSDAYKEIFPGVQIAADAKAAGKWNTTKGGEVYAVGVGGALAGRGAHLCIVDDPLSEQDIKAGNTSSLDTVYEWFRAGLRTRLMPEGRIAILHCLTGDTSVTMADGSEKPLRDVRPGDLVASYAAGALLPAKVLGWANQGLDQVYSIGLKSGVKIRGNERHPLLVNNVGVEQWVKIKELRPGMHLVSTRGAQTPPTAKRYEGSASPATTKPTKLSGLLDGFMSRLYPRTTPARLKGVHVSGDPSENQALAGHATPESITTRKTPTRLGSRWGITASGKVKHALQKAAALLYTVKGYAVHALTKQPTPLVRPKVIIIARPSAAMPISKCAMGSLALTTTSYSLPKVGHAPFAPSHLTKETPPLSGKFGGWPWTTATKLAKSALFYAMSAISLSKSATPPSGFAQPLTTLSITLDEIVSITPDGEEDVFDIQVEGTENFIANGVVSHNTRWHQRDLIGRLIKDGALNPDGDVYEMFEFPAILASADGTQKSLWPEQWSLESLLRTRESMPAWQWNAQYQQDPTAQEAAIIKADDIMWWPKETPPTCEFVVQAFDTALTTKQRSDYSVCQTWGVWRDEDGVDNVILLECIRDKLEFPELKKMAHEQYKLWNPDSVVVETKASGQPLVDELRRSGIFVQEFSPGKGQDKIARVNAISDMFASKQVWFPETRWATNVVDEILAFPAGEHDDQVDAMTLALARVRQGGLVRLNSDVEDKEMMLPRKASYY